ncbi:MAG TPA: VTT domain-containing protein [Candidatus Saccharimonadales bacterium]|nr:VTT domain-containing protein [Candidatus Saccharimonadales bacterium]
MFERFAGQLPLELFVFAGCFAEEAISPIPSFVVLIPAGAAAQVQGVEWWYLIVLSFIGASGRILASLLLYFVAFKAEHWLFGKKGRRFFGVTHEKLQTYGRRFSGSRRDWIVLFLLNAIPVLPTSVLSLTCGFIKIDLKLFITATYFGSAVNALCYMSIGYFGIQAAAALRHLELAFQIITAAVIVAVFVAWFVHYKRRKR